MMIENLGSETRPFIGKDIGRYNREYVKLFKRKLTAAFGDEGEKARNMNSEKFIEKIRPLYETVTQKS
jgi:hypothetical protein